MLPRVLRSRLKPSADVLVGALVVLLVTSPAFLTHSGFGPDYSNHLWLLWHQGRSISESGGPTLFVHTNHDLIFEPFFGFYGGTLYAAGGYISWALGNHPRVAYIAIIILAGGMGYGGWVWLARLAGARRWLAHAPAVVFVTGPYYLTDLFARGAWTEYVALSALPLALAGFLHHVSRPWRVGTVAPFVLAVVLFTGSHNISLLWGTMVALPTVLAIGALTPKARRPDWVRLGATTGLVALGAAVNAWFLFFDLVHAGDTVAAKGIYSPGSTPGFQDLSNLLDPFRGAPASSTTPHLSVALPVFTLAWALLVPAFVLWRSRGRVQTPEPATARPGAWRWYLLSLGLLAAVLAVLLPADVISSLGYPFTTIQFAYRLNGYVLMAICGLVLAVVLMPLGRAPLAVLGAVLAVSLFQGVLQGWDARDGTGPKDSRLALVNPEIFPPGWYDPVSYGDASATLIDPSKYLRLPGAPRVGQRDWTTTADLAPYPQTTATNIAAGSYAVTIHGARAVGRTSGGTLVLRRDGPGDKPVPLQVTQTKSFPLDAGRLVTYLALVLTALLLLVLAIPRAAARLPQAIRPPRPAG
jgi:hypothetical protein